MKALETHSNKRQVQLQESIRLDLSNLRKVNQTKSDTQLYIQELMRKKKTFHKQKQKKII